ncbi:MAG: GNAT family N-acetyltransferase [Pseudomonadota bacterium]
MTHPWETPPRPEHRATVAAFAALVPVLETDRLHLRAPRVADFPAYAEILETAGKFIGVEDRTDAWIDFMQMAAQWPLRGFGPWSIAWRDAPDTMLGLIPFDHEAGDPEPEIGWMLTAAARGRGIATEATRAALAHAFGPMGFTTLVAYIRPDNAASIAVAGRLGATRDAVAEAALTDTQVHRFHAGPRP